MEDKKAKQETKRSVRDALSPMDLLIVVSLLKRLLGKNADIREFLEKIDEPEELQKLYDAVAVFVELVD